MRILTPSIAAFCALLCLPLSGCGEDEAPAPTAPPAAAELSRWPTSPLPMPVAPPQAPRPWGFGLKTEQRGAQHVLPQEPSRVGEMLPVAVRLRTEDGDQPLGKLLAGNSLVLFMDTDLRDKQNRAATRLLRRLIKSGRGMGFRIVVVFARGASMDDAQAWMVARHLDPAPVAAIDEDGEFERASGWAPRSAALVDPKGTVGVFFGPSTAWDSRVGFDGGLTSDLLYRAWDMPEPPPTVSPADEQAAVDLVRRALRSTAADDPELKAAAEALSRPVPRGLWLSLYRPGSTTSLRRRVEGGTLGEGLATLGRDLLQGPGAPDGWAEDAAKLTFAIDLEGPPVVLPTRDERALWYLLEPGVDGARVRKGDAVGVLLPHEPVTRGLLTPRVRGRGAKLKKLLGVASSDAGLARDAWRGEDVTVERFRTTNFGVVTPDGPATDFFRGNVLWKGMPGEAEILESIRLGGEWLAQTVGEDGKFAYEYYPNQDKHPPGYNIVRHAGSVYGLFEMWHLSQQEPTIAPDAPVYLNKASRAMGFIYDALKPPRDAREPDRVCLVEHGACESGSVALTLLTFLGRPDPSEVPPNVRRDLYRQNDAALMEGLALTMVDMIDSKGKVYRRYRDAVRFDRVKKEPIYYPGEVMLALMRYYEQTKDPRWLDAAKRIAARQVAWYKRDRFITPDHWVMQALLHLWRVTKDDAYAESAYKMANHYCSEQYPYIWQPFPDYFGAWRRDDDAPRTTRAGSRSEALRAVTHLAWERGDDATVYEDALLRAARHLMEQQYTRRNSYWVPKFEEVRGAYPMGVVDNHVRIDNNQHALVGMTGALEVARHRAGK